MIRLAQSGQNSDATTEADSPMILTAVQCYPFEMSLYVLLHFPYVYELNCERSLRERSAH
jgi:hypothetical protein